MDRRASADLAARAAQILNGTPLQGGISAQTGSAAPARTATAELAAREDKPAAKATTIQNLRQQAQANPQAPDLRVSDPNQMRRTLGSLMRGIGGPESAPLGVLPDGSLVRDVRYLAKVPSRLKAPFGGLDERDQHNLAKTMVPGGASPRKGTNGSAVQPPDNISRYLPGIASALRDKQLDDADMLLYALATIRAEASGFAPVSEGVKRGNGQDANTTPGGKPFDKYDSKNGNKGPGEGELFKGRGFIQLTGRSKYERYAKAIGHPELVTNPDMANDPQIAALLLAQYLKDNEARIRAATKANDVRAARRVVNGGTNGLEDFKTALRSGRDYMDPRPRLNLPGMQPKHLPDLLPQDPQAMAPLGVTPDGSLMRDATQWAKTPSRILTQPQLFDVPPSAIQPSRNQP